MQSNEKTSSATNERETSPLDPVRDLAWSADRAREFGGRMVELWGELLERIPWLPGGGRAGAAGVRARVARAAPDEPLPTDELFDALRTITFEYSTYTGNPG